MTRYFFDVVPGILVRLFFAVSALAAADVFEIQNRYV